MISTIASVLSPLATVQSAPLNPTIKPYESLFNPTLFLYGYNDSQYGPDHMENEPGLDYDNFTLDEFFRTLDQDNFTNGTNSTDNTDHPQIPAYIRTTSMVFCIIIMCLGVVGNVMVPIVIMKTKDMRNSTNIFLMNLSIADLMVLLVCTPTVLVEVNTKPETWVLGKEMCLAVPFVELTVAHASVLTILAISFERYYAICEPLKAGYVCTKTRAALICFMAWFVAAVFTSPILSVASYQHQEYIDGSMVPVCLTQADTFWPAFFFISTISVFFFIPLAILIILYTIIAKNLMENPGIITQNNKHNAVSGNSVLRYRKQVVMMLGTVVLSFFVCLLPFRAFTLWIIIVPDETVNALGVEGYYITLYFSRIMLYLNSAVNPILYNLMSSKFRDGFLRLLRLNRFKRLQRYKRDTIQRKDTFNTTTSTNFSSSQNNTDSFWRRYSSNRHVSQKSPQKCNGSTRKLSQTEQKQHSKVSEIVSVQNTRRNSMRFVSEVILIPKEKVDNNGLKNNADLEDYLDKSYEDINNVEDNAAEDNNVGYQNCNIVKDGIVVEGLVSIGDKKTHFVRVPLLVSKNATTISKNCLSQFGKESFV